jgi:2-methylcitrate dehydratase PrpD
MSTIIGSLGTLCIKYSILTNDAVRASDPTLSERLASFLVETPATDIPPSVRAMTSLLVLDALGTAIGNRGQPFAVALRSVAATSAREGPCTILGTDAPRMEAEAAAEINSAAIHGSDLDATHIASIIHPTAVSVPVGLATGEEAGATGEQTMAAIALGAEALVRLGLAAGGAYHVRGYQATALLGPVVAAMMAARLRRGDRRVATEAAGLATAVAAGLRSFSDDGTWGKRLITGWACRAGLHAEALVAAGFRGSRDALEKPWGLFPAFLPAGGFELARATKGLGHEWHVLATEPKRYPCSHGLHPFIEASRRARDGFEVDAIERIECHVNDEAVRWWFEPRQTRYRPDAYSARFSIPYTVARALLDGTVADQAFEAESVTEAEVLALADRVKPRVDPELADQAPVGLPGRMTIHRRDGSTMEIPAAEGREDDDAFVRDRFRTVVGEALGTRAASALEAGVDAAWSSIPIREIVVLARA